MALGKAKVNILANLKPLQRGLMNAKTAVKGMVKSIASGSFKILRAGLVKITQAAKVAGAAILGIGIASVKIASDAQETANLFQVSMGDMADAAEEWVRRFAASIGLNETNIKKMLGSFKLMTESMGFSSQEASKMSQRLTKLVYDFASLQNLKPEEAFIKIQAGLSGEIEPLKRYGIVINEAALQQAALKDETIKLRKETKKQGAEYQNVGGLIVKRTGGIKKGTIALSEQEKVMLRYKLLLEKLKPAEDDMLNTRNQTANVFRVISEQLKTTAENIGGVFLPMVTKVATAVRDWLRNNQEQIVAWSNVIKENIQIAIDWVSQLIDLGKSGNWQAVFENIGEVIGRAIRSAIEWVKQYMPLAVDLGKKIGEGLWAQLETTPFGKYLKAAGKVVGASEKVGDFIGTGLGNLRGHYIKKGVKTTPESQEAYREELFKRRKPDGSFVRKGTTYQKELERYTLLDMFKEIKAFIEGDESHRVNEELLAEVKSLNRNVRKQSEEF